MNLSNTVSWVVSGSNADPVSVIAKDVTGTWGVKRLDTNAVVVPSGTAYSRDGVGVYSLEVDSASWDVGYQFDTQVTYLLAGTNVTVQLPSVVKTAQGIEIPALGSDPSYCVDGDLAQRFGDDIVNSYARMCGEEPWSLVVSRRAWARYMASRDVDDALRGGQYQIPFVGPPFDSTIVDITAYLALIRLYELKGTIDWSVETGKPQHRYHFQKSFNEERLRKIRSGLIRLRVSAGYKTGLGVRNDRVGIGAVEGRRDIDTNNAYPDANGPARGVEHRYFG